MWSESSSVGLNAAKLVKKSAAIFFPGGLGLLFWRALYIKLYNVLFLFVAV